MKFDLKPEKYEDFKEFMAGKLTKETGRLYLPEEIFVEYGKNDSGFLKWTEIVNDEYKFVFGNVIYTNCKEEVFKNLEYVNDNFSIKNSNIKKIESLRYIGGYGNFFNCSLEGLGNLNFIAGDVNFRGTFRLKSLQNLAFVGKSLSLEYSEIEDLGELEYVGHSLDLESSRVSDLGNLKYVGKDLFIRNLKIISLGELKYVGGKLFMNDIQKGVFADSIYEDEGGNIRFKNDENYKPKHEFVEMEQ